MYIGDFAEDETIYTVFNTFTSDDPAASCTITNFVNNDVHIHKDDGTTQRNNAAGITVSVNFDGITGSHMIKIDTNDNTVAGFWVTGHDYFVRIEGTTVDGATMNAMVCHFSIENRFMRGTDSGATAAALTTHDGKLDTLDTVADGIQTDLSNATDGLGALKTLLDAIPTTAMRGTDSAALAATALSDATWTDAKAGHLDAPISTVDTVVDGIQTDLSNVTDGLGALKALLDTISGYTDKIDDATNGLTAIKAEVEGLAGAAMRGTDGANTTTPPTVGAIRTEMEGAGSKLLAIEGDTNELHTDWVNGGRLDLLIDSIITDLTAIDVLTEAGGDGDLAAIKTQVDAILDLERTSGVVSVTSAETTIFEDASPTKNKLGVCVKIDMAAVAAGDTFIVREKYKDESGGAYQEIDAVTYTGAQSKPLRVIALTPYRYGAIVTMQKTAGTDRSIEWEAFVEG